MGNEIVETTANAVQEYELSSKVEELLVNGNLAKLNEKERVEYYGKICNSMGLNPLTKPFDYITLNGKLTLYATKNATEQLRKIYKVSVIDLVQREVGGVLITTCKVQDGFGRIDTSTGAVNISNLQGDALANAIMKSETKAKRRATLSICGLGMLDESELETIKDISSKPKLNSNYTITNEQIEKAKEKKREKMAKGEIQTAEVVEEKKPNFREILLKNGLKETDLASFSKWAGIKTKKDVEYFENNLNELYKKIDEFLGERK